MFPLMLFPHLQDFRLLPISCDGVTLRLEGERTRFWAGSVEISVKHGKRRWWFVSRQGRARWWHAMHRLLGNWTLIPGWDLLTTDESNRRFSWVSFKEGRNGTDDTAWPPLLLVYTLQRLF